MQSRKHINRTIFSAIILVLILSNSSFANPIPSSYRDTPQVFFMTMVFNIVVDFLAIYLGFSLIKKIQLIKSRKFLTYLAMVVIGGFFIDEVFTYIIIPISETLEIWFFRSFEGLLTIPIVFIISSFIPVLFLLLFYNRILSEYFFKISKEESLVVGLTIGIITNPLYITLLI